MGNRIGIFGTSGMARETRDIAHDLGFSVVFVARDPLELEAFTDNGDIMLESDIDRFNDMPYVIGVGEGALRRRIATRFAGKIKFGNLIHPTATFGRNQREQLECKQGIIVCAGVRFTSNTLVGDFAIFNINATVSHDCIIGDFVTVSPQACLLGNVEVKSGAWIGAGATIIQGTHESKLVIGENTLIGLGAVVLNDCNANSVYVGVPAKMVQVTKEAFA